MRHDDFDRQFDEAFEEAAKQLQTAPDSSSSWDEVSRITKNMNRRKRFYKRLQVSAVVACSVLLGAIITGSPTISRAFSPFIQQMKAVENSVVGFFFGNTGQTDRSAKTSPPPDEKNDNPSGAGSEISGEKRKEIVSLEEAKKKVSFPFPALPTLDTFQIKEITLFFDEQMKTATQARINYTSDDHIKKFNIYLTELTPSTVLSSGGNNSTGEVESVKLYAGGEGFIAPAGDNRFNIEFLSRAVHFMIIGDLNKEEIIQLANQIKKDTDG
ncbi:hypothetical protein [Paenibacillus eucommiae]|uniref:DUF4367 domain-containing protein n=1 Tax=Paenibacillus eucommiae TaxID=1355755 RepID=A0ABS4J692_9BACL|nr:hypothetical protein [Paenibacillus eucommiae]MBP1994319.1 hypothetical protein [Paenibacillus eucommiae]